LIVYRDEAVAVAAGRTEYCSSVIAYCRRARMSTHGIHLGGGKAN